jgi:hypothetical protein
LPLERTKLKKMARTKQRPSGRIIGRGRGVRLSDAPAERQRRQQQQQLLQPVRRRRHRPGTDFFSKIKYIFAFGCSSSLSILSISGTHLI